MTCWKTSTLNFLTGAGAGPPGASGRRARTARTRRPSHRPASAQRRSWPRRRPVAAAAGAAATARESPPADASATIETIDAITATSRRGKAPPTSTIAARCHTSGSDENGRPRLVACILRGGVLVGGLVGGLRDQRGHVRLPFIAFAFSTPRVVISRLGAVRTRAQRRRFTARRASVVCPRGDATRSVSDIQLSNLQELEAEAVLVMREVAAEFERPVLLFSGGKDSIVLLRLAEKAFRPAPFPFPVMHVDTGTTSPRCSTSATAACGAGRAADRRLRAGVDRRGRAVEDRPRRATGSRP